MTTSRERCSVCDFPREGDAVSEYTKEQEAEALSRVERNIYGTRDIDILYTMAKRTAEAEARADASEADAKRLADDWAAVLLERDALKARVAELEAKAAQSPFGPSVDPVEAARGIAEIQRAMSPSPPVVVTREMLEMMLADAETRAVYGRGDVPLNPAARLVVALGEALEVKS